MSTTTALARRPMIEAIKESAPEFAKRLPAHVDATKWTMQLATVVQKNEELLRCEPASLLLAAYEAAEVGINLSPSLGLGYIIPYGQKANFQIGYRGMIQKAYETQAVRNIFAEVVYEHDKFERQFAPKRNLFHAPADGDRGQKIGAYALVEFADGHIEFEYLTNEQIERHRKHSKQPNSLMWSTFWEEGWRKTPIRVLFKRLPLTNPGLEKLAEVVGTDAERDLEPEAAGRLEIEPDGPLAQLPKKASPEPPAQDSPVPKAVIPKFHDILVHIGAKTTTLTGDVRKIVKDLPKCGAKLDKDTGTWTVPSGRAHEVIALCDANKLTWAEVDADGNPVPQDGEGTMADLFERSQ